MAIHYYSKYGLGTRSGADKFNAMAGMPKFRVPGDKYVRVK